MQHLLYLVIMTACHVLVFLQHDIFAFTNVRKVTWILYSFLQFLTNALKRSLECFKETEILLIVEMMLIYK